MSVCTRFSILVACMVMLCGCPPPNDEKIYRGKKDGQLVQKIVVAVYDEDGRKSDRFIKEYRWSKSSKAWIQTGARNYSDADAQAELSNVSGYDGNQSDPPASAAIVTPNNIYWAKNSGDNEVIAVDAKALTVLTRIRVPGFMYALAASPDGLTVAVPTANFIWFIDVLSNRVTRTLTLPTFTSIKSLHFSLDGTRLFLADRAAGIRIVRVSDAALLQTVPLPGGISQLESSAISPDGEYLFVRTSGTNSTAIFDITTLTFTAGASSGAAFLYSEVPCVFHSTGKEIYCISTDGIAIFNAATMTVTASIKLPSGESPSRLHIVDGGEFILLSTIKTVRMIDPVSRQILATLSAEPRTFFTSAYPVSVF